MKFRLGLFDSGVGGFTVLRRILEFYPDVSCIYLADTARVPYGNRNNLEIREIANELVCWLMEQELSAVLIACNTTNSLALDIIEKNSNVPTFGLIKAASTMVREKRVGVLATPATVKSNSYTREILRIRPDTFVLEQSCPLLVPMIESGKTTLDNFRVEALKYLTPLLEARVESIVLGCSHYPLIKSILRELLPSNVRLIDPAIGLADNLEPVLGAKKMSPAQVISLANTGFFVTSDPADFAMKTKLCFGTSSEVDLVSLRTKACIF